MSQQAIETLEAATAKARRKAGHDARFSLFDTDADRLADVLRVDLAPLAASVERRSPAELLLTLPGRRFTSDEAAFRAADALATIYELDAAEPEIFYTAMPIDIAEEALTEGADFIPGCWVGEEPDLDARKRWALDAIRVTAAWAYADAHGRPSRGAGIVVAQPDTGITRHDELKGVTLVAPRNLLGGKPNDPTDPLPQNGNPGHGTSTASVLVSPETIDIAGSAPAAKLMPIRAIESVVRLSQINVARAIDYAVDNGAHVITMSLGGIPSLSLWWALSRAVETGVIVMAAAGNCVGLVVWPARYEKCISVAGVDQHDRRWAGSCRGSQVDFAAPGQNVFRAAAPNNGVGQGEGTSYAVALAAGVAACWLAYHGRSNVVAGAAARGETVQEMFRRLAKATARVPDGWDAYNMGAGVLDAEALLKADFDRGLGTESPTAPMLPESPANSVRSLALSKLGESALKTGLDWESHGAEIALALLRGGRLPTAAAAPAPTPSSGTEAVHAEAPAAPAVHRRKIEQPAFRKLRRNKALLAQRAATAEGVVLESTGTLESMANEPLSRHAANATLERIVSLAEKMPPREIADRNAFVAALNLLAAQGGDTLRVLVGDSLDSGSAATPEDAVALEAIVIADGSRPSFLIENDLPPATHPFMGDWADEMAKARNSLAPFCAAIGRIQSEYGHAGNYIGTGSLVDARNGIVLTNYHVLDDARSKFGVLMEEKDSVVTVHDWLEIDFVGEASRFDTNRFRIREARLPPDAGRGFNGLDAVTLRIEPVDGGTMPAALPFNAAVDAFRLAESKSLCSIGFPGPPQRVQGPKGKVDWNFVVKTLFGELFGYKRLAPGRMLERVGSVADDRLRISFGHELTTFGGASGSPLIGWEQDQMAGLGLHFSGLTGTSNYAIAITRVAAQLRAIGVPV